MTGLYSGQAGVRIAGVSIINPWDRNGENKITRIINLPAGARATVNQNSEDFITVDVLHPDGTREVWYPSWVNAERGTARLVALGTRTTPHGGGLLFWLCQAWLSPVYLLWFLLWPIRSLFAFLAEDAARTQAALDYACGREDNEETTTPTETGKDIRPAGEWVRALQDAAKEIEW